jgi:predicted nucleotidyltransferase
LSAPPLRLRELLEQLLGARIDFVLIGGLAVNAWGYLRATRDLDIVPAPGRGNLERLTATLEELGARVEVEGGLLGADAVRTFLLAGDRAMLITDLGYLDVVQAHPQVPPWEELSAAAVRIDLDGLEVRVCSLEHLLEMKRASDRPRDRDDIEALEAARERD